MTHPRGHGSLARLAPLALVLALLAPARAQIVEGERYPNLRLPTIDLDRAIAIDELRGTKVLLIEFASW